MSNPYQLTTLRNGLTVVLHHMPHARSTSVGVWVKAGGRYESPRLSGASHFLEHLLFKGTRRRSCEALKQAIEGVGGSLNGFTDEEFTCYMAKVPSRHARRAIAVLTELVAEPTLSARDTEKERGVILEEIRMYEDAPGQYVHDLFNQLLWPDHPLGRLLSGTCETVKGITRDDLLRYWRRMYHPANWLVTCTGAFNSDEVMGQIREALGSIPRHARVSYPRAPRARRGPQVRVWNKSTEQTHLCIGTYATPRTHPDRFALELLHVILGANMSSRLFREVREKRGLVYEIGTHIKRLNDTGAFLIYAGCDTQRIRETMQTIFHELSRIRHIPLTHAELARAKDYYAGQLVMGLEDTMEHMLWIGEQALMVGRVAAPDVLLKHLAKVTPQDVQRVATALFHTERMHVAVVGPLSDTTLETLRDVCRIH